MATYNFSALSSGASLAFDPAVDVLFFDQTAISAANLRAVAEGAGTRITVMSGTDAGKSILLQNTLVAQLAIANVTFANGSRVLIGDTALAQNDGANNTITGTGSSDLLYGLGGNDALNGGSGNDWVEGGAGADTLTGSGGQDMFAIGELGGADVFTDFATGWDSIRLNAVAFSAIGAAGRFASGDARFWSAAGASSGHDADDRIVFNTTTRQLFYDADGSGAGASQLIATLSNAGNLVASDIWVFAGGTPPPPPPPPSGINGTAGNDSLLGTSASDSISGLGGGDTLDGAGAADTLSGGAGGDSFMFTTAPGAATADRVTDFASGTDRIRLDADVMGALGLDGNFAAGDARFWSAAGANAGHDADDRVVYNTTTGQLWYDADGSGAGAAQLIATLQAGAALAAADIAVVNGSTTPPPRAETQQEILQVPHSGNIEIDALLANWVAWDRMAPFDNVLTYTFSVSSGTLPGTPATAFDAAQQAATRQIIAEAAAITGIAFAETSDGNAADLHFATTVPGSYSGYFTWTAEWQFNAAGVLTRYVPDGYVYLSSDPAYQTLEPGTYGYHVMVHEVGHALGLKHPFDIPLVMPLSEDNTDHSAMAYNQGPSGISSHFEELDIAALQWIYGGDGLGGAGARASGPYPIFGAGGNESLAGGTGHDYLWGGTGNDTIAGGAGNDFLQGTDGIDSLDGGAGDDIYFSQGEDQIVDASGIDTIISGIIGTLGASFENLFLVGTTRDATGNTLANVINGNGADNVITGLEGNDTMYGGGGNDVFVMTFGAGSSYGADYIDGGFFLVDTLDYSAARSAVTVNLPGNVASGGGVGGAGSAQLFDIENVTGGAFADRIVGSNWFNSLQGGAGADTLTGGEQIDRFVYAEAGAANADLITDFAVFQPVINPPPSDALVFDGNFFLRIGQADFAFDDARYWEAAGASAGHDADDRLVYNLSTGQLWYDADGGGAGASQLVLTLQGAPNLDAAQIDIVNGRPDTPPPSGGVSITGTAGNDSLAGGAGDDTLNGLAGSDTLRGGEGSDSMAGGDGDDVLDGYSHTHGDTDPSVDSMNGGLGNDLFHVDNAADVILDSGGVDTVAAYNMDWTLGAGFENLIINNGQSESLTRGIGNGVNNLINGGNDSGPADGWHVWLEGLGGNDTLIGSTQDDALLSGGEGNDSIDGGWDYDSLEGGAGNDTLFGGVDFHDEFLAGGAGADVFVLYAQGLAELVSDFATGVDKVQLNGQWFAGVGASGNYAAGDDRFVAAAAAQDAEDRVIWNGSELWYDEDGTGAAAAVILARLQAGASVVATDIAVVNGTTPPPPPPPSGGVAINGTSGNDSLVGSAGADTINGGGGNDSILGGAGRDRVTGSGGQDAFTFGERGAADWDNITDFATGWDRLSLDDAGFGSIGALGRFAAGDGRFWAAAGANTGHDATDRIVFNTSTGQLWYDRDGSGSAAAELVATVQAGAGVAATDIYVI